MQERIDSMTKNSRLSFALAVLILLFAAALRLYRLDSLPLGLNEQEIIDIRLAENTRQGDLQVFYNVGGQGRDLLYPVILAAVTTLTGGGALGYHLLSAWIGIVTVALVYAVGKRLYGDLAGLAAMSLTAVSLFPTLLSRLAMRETLLPALITAVLLTMALAFPVYYRKRSAVMLNSAFLTLAVLLGLGIYLHPAALMIGVVFAVYLAYMLLPRRRRTIQLLTYSVFAVIVATILAAPYLTSAMRLPDLGGMGRLVEGLTSDLGTIPARIFNGLLAIGIQGDANAAFNVPGRPLFDAISMVLIGVGFVVTARTIRKPRYALVFFAALLMLPLALLAPESPSNLAFAAVYPVLALLFGLGVAYLASRSQLRRLAHALLAVIILFNTAWTLYDLFDTWEALPAVYETYNSDIAQLAKQIDRSAHTTPTVICARGITTQRPQLELPKGRLLSLMVNRQAAALRYVECNTGMLFINGGDTPQQIVVTDRGFDGTSPLVLEWFQISDVVSRPDLPEGGLYRLNARDVLADKIGRFTTTAPYALAPEVRDGESVGLPPPVPLENNLTFLGYESLDIDFAPGDTVTVVTYWRVEGPLPSDLTLFTHVLDDPGASPVANTDTISIIPAQLQNRDVFMHVSYIRLPDTLPAGEYIVSVGAYRRQSSERLRVLAENGTVTRGNRLILYTINTTGGEGGED
jgi:4-amino-4-deoxy-L-arabinose transferase-like glycosyltransferase